MLGVSLNASFSAHMPAAENLALISQSGAIAAGMVDRAAQCAVGFSGVVSIIDHLDVDIADFLDYFGEFNSRRTSTAGSRLSEFLRNTSVARIANGESRKIEREGSRRFPLDRPDRREAPGCAPPRRPESAARPCGIVMGLHSSRFAGGVDVRSQRAAIERLRT
jgi:hypothetical protein